MSMFFLALFFFIVLGYLIGSFPTAYIMGKIFSRTDIRQRGSGNVGATNVLRVSGTAAGIITLIVDMGKGFLVVWAVSLVSGRYLQTFFDLGQSRLPYLPLCTGLAAVIGHNWPVFLKFKGGKGVAITMGVCLALYPVAVISMILVWVLLLFFTRYVSLASVISALTLPFFIWLYSSRRESNLTLEITYSSILALLIFWRHQGNIRRLVHHQEKKISFSKSE